MSIHLNSLAAYRTEKKTLDHREREILLWLIAHPGEYTDREIQHGMGFMTRADVQPRVSTLIIDGGLLVETGKKKCPLTGRSVRTVTLSEKVMDALSNRSTPPAPSSPHPAPYSPSRHVIPDAGQCALFS